MIDLTGVDLDKFAKKVYELSVPQGLGFLHFKPGELKDTKPYIKETGGVALSMDYVEGRACKMTIHRSGKGLAMNDTWYDHTDSQLERLLKEFGIKYIPGQHKHSMSCGCTDCRRK